MFLALIFAFTAVSIWLLYLLKWKYTFWSKAHVKYLKPTLLLGNYGDYILQRKDIGEVVSDLCKRLPDEPMFGAFYGTEPVLVVQSPELIKQVFTKDFYYFNGREISDFNHNEVLTRNLFFSHGDTWRVLRQNLTPLFSSAKMKNMFHIIVHYSEGLESLLDREIATAGDVDVRSIMSRFTMDCIMSCAFGVDPKVQSHGEGNVFRKIGDAFFDISRLRGIKTHVRALWPSIFYGLKMKLFPNEIDKFFSSIARNVFTERESGSSTRQDFIDLMMSLKSKAFVTGDSIENMRTRGAEKVDIAVDEKLLVSQCTVFFAAGYETSATTAAFTLFELAKHPELLRRAHAEVDAYTARRKLDYDCVSLPFLSQCVSETLRLYPVLPVLTRETRAAHGLGGAALPAGTRVHVPVYHLHRDPQYFPEPERFLPERFAPENKSSIVPYSYLPFGEGPRICIGMRFAHMQMMAGLVTVLKKYSVSLAPGMPRTPELVSTAMVTQARGGVRLRLEARAGWEGRAYAA